ncbi:MAG: antibiotic biosynthesis monooxygenase [Planctomycetes bacterium]|nr:antibiotic biosynthesis monooxygenase [Planctomycetota bacterium]
MILVMNRFTVTPGREKDFEEAFKGRAKLVETLPGFMGFDVLRPTHSTGSGQAEEGGVFISMTRWASMADFENWTQSEAFKQGHSRRHPGMFAGHPQLEIFEVFDSTLRPPEGAQGSQEA